MGLDVLYCRHVEPISAEEAKRREEAGGLCARYSVTDERFLPRLAGLEAEFVAPADGEEFQSFRAGSYGAYTQWRDRLSMVMLGAIPDEVWQQPALFEEMPFYPLIDFSDCEGCIGPKVSARLAGDFVANSSRFAEHPLVGAFSVKTYENFMAAFLAAGGSGRGVVVFR